MKDYCHRGLDGSFGDFDTMFSIENFLKIAQEKKKKKKKKKLLALLCRFDRVANTFTLLSVTQGPDVELMWNQIAIWADLN